MKHPVYQTTFSTQHGLGRMADPGPISKKDNYTDWPTNEVDCDPDKLEEVLCS